MTKPEQTKPQQTKPERFKDVPNVLAKIVEDKLVRIEELKAQLPLDSFKDKLTPSNKCLYQSLSQPQAGFILECKKASPSKGLIRKDFDVAKIARTYNKYAAGISVLTDEKYFQGKYQYLKTVTEIVDCPVLNKDFFVDPYQVYLARYYGADAILLMLSVLDDNEYLALAAIAEQYQLNILTEISNQQELERAVALDAKLIGINNRNLRDLSTDIARTFDFAPHIPQDRLVISESGIYTNHQVRELAPAVDGFLVGSSVMAQDDIDLACRKLIFGDHKVCGLSTIEDVQAVSEAGAVYGGLIFAEKSPRFVDIEQAKTLVKSTNSINVVGVFVNHDIDFVADAAKQLNLYAVQLHGQEDSSYIEQLQATLSKLEQNTKVWRALPVTEQVPSLDFAVDAYVLDGKAPGSGQPFSWQRLRETEQDLSYVMLAGGINLDNVNEALTVVTEQELQGLDINSGVESSLGKKSAAKINEIFAEIRNY